MFRFSAGLLNAILDVDVLSVLEELHKKFKSGNRTALMEALLSCSLYNVTIPDWVADELLTLDKQLDEGQFKDLNEFFNFGKPEHKTTLEQKLNLKVKNKRVVNALFDQKINGSDLSRVERRNIAAELGVSQSMVEIIYKENMGWLDNLPRKAEVNSGYMIGELPSLLELAKFRREQQDN
ncbi:MAG: hypothetical protein GQ583_12930 [Methyloprofundus sp.]|nr:hypothetical protein [Methyloprofundus sp.]